MYNKIFRGSVSLSTIALAIELVQLPAFQSLTDAMVDTYAFIQDMEDSLHN